jgi:hypothetical protein
MTGLSTKRKIPINIVKSEIAKLSTNLSSFLYDFKDNNDCKIEKFLKGAFIVKLDDVDSAYFTTMGKLTYIRAICVIGGINKYDGIKPDIEIILEMKNKNNKLLYIFIPIKIGNNSLCSKWFSQFSSLVNNDEVSFTSNVNGWNFNDVITRCPFVYYNAKADIIGLKESCNMIFLTEFNTIEKEYYDQLVSAFGKVELNDTPWTNGNDDSWLNIDNWEMQKIYNQHIYYNAKGTKDGPGLEGIDGSLPLTCEVINDEKDEPIGGEKRLEWIKGTISGVDSSVKSGFYLVMLIILLIGALIGFYVFIFKKLGIFFGGPGIIGRNKSAT